MVLLVLAVLVVLVVLLVLLFFPLSLDNDLGGHHGKHVKLA
jgi:hypothetical protein